MTPRRESSDEAERSATETRSLPGGIYPYLVSPVEPGTGKIMEGVLAALVDDLIDAGVHGLSPLGSTGEVMYLTREQRETIVETTVRLVVGRVPVVPGVAAFGTLDAIEQARAFQEVGVDGLVVMRQSVEPGSTRAIIEYFEAVAREVTCPVVLYSNPRMLGEELPLDAIEVLSEIPNIRYIKDASSNTGRVFSILQRFGARLEVFSASAHVPLVVLEFGGIGWMSGPASVIPHAAAELYRRFQEGDREGAQLVQHAFWPICEAFQRYPIGACVKAALELRGYDVGSPIAPEQRLDERALEEISLALGQVDHVMSAEG